MQQDHVDTGRVGLAVEPLGERAARAAATLTRLDEPEHQVRRGRLPDERRYPARRLGPLRGQQPDRLAVALREPGPRRRPVEQPGRLLLERGERPRPFGYLAEKRVPPDDFEAKPGHGGHVARLGSPDPQVRIRIIPNGPAAPPSPSRNRPGGENLERRETVSQQRGDAVRIPAGPVDLCGRVRIARARHLGQVLPPPSEQPVKAAVDVGPGNFGRQPEPARGSPGQVQAVWRTRPVRTAAGSGHPPGGPGNNERRAAACRGPRHDRRQQRVDPPPALQHPRTDVAHRIRLGWPRDAHLFTPAISPPRPSVQRSLK